MVQLLTAQNWPPLLAEANRVLQSQGVLAIGKTKGPILRGLSGRAPYFHNGSARNLGEVVDFYETRFNIGLTAQERADLIAFLLYALRLLQPLKQLSQMPTTAQSSLAAAERLFEVLDTPSEDQTDTGNRSL